MALLSYSILLKAPQENFYCPSNIQRMNLVRKNLYNSDAHTQRSDPYPGRNRCRSIPLRFQIITTRPLFRLFLCWRRPLLISLIIPIDRKAFNPVQTPIAPPNFPFFLAKKAKIVQTSNSPLGEASAGKQSTKSEVEIEEGGTRESGHISRIRGGTKREWRLTKP